MDIKIKNLGAIKQADLMIDDITLIAGRNNSGKSTVGKAIFTALHSISFAQEKTFPSKINPLINSRVGILTSIIRNHIEKSNFEYRGQLMDVLYGLESSNTNKVEPFKLTSLLEKLKDIFSNNQDVLKEMQPNISIIENFLNSKPNNLSAKKEIFKSILKAEFTTPIHFEDEKEHDLDVKPLNEIFSSLESFGETFNEDDNKNKNTCSIEIDDLKFEYTQPHLTFRNKTIKFIEEKIETNYSSYKFYGYNDAILLESPMLLNFNEIVQGNINVYFKGENHASYLLKLLTEVENKNALYEKIIYKEALKIEKKIEKIIKGHLFFDSESNKIKFNSTDGSHVDLGINDLATGVKSLGMLLMLLKKMTPKTVLVLDEPEVHLHPEWQVILAEIITLISKELKIKILITTHSPFFLEAMESYGKKYSMKNNFYYCEDGSLKNVTDQISLVYQKINGKAYDMLDALNQEIESEIESEIKSEQKENQKKVLATEGV